MNSAFDCQSCFFWCKLHPAGTASREKLKLLQLLCESGLVLCDTFSHIFLNRDFWGSNNSSERKKLNCETLSVEFERRAGRKHFGIWGRCYKIRERIFKVTTKGKKPLLSFLIFNTNMFHFNLMLDISNQSQTEYIKKIPPCIQSPSALKIPDKYKLLVLISYHSVIPVKGNCFHQEKTCGRKLGRTNK